MSYPAISAAVAAGLQGASALIVFVGVARVSSVQEFAPFAVAVYAFPLVAVFVEWGTGPIALRELASGRASLPAVVSWSAKRLWRRILLLCALASVVSLVAADPVVLILGPFSAAAARAVERTAFDALRGASSSTAPYNLLSVGHAGVIAIGSGLYAVGLLTTVTAWAVLSASAVPLLASIARAVPRDAGDTANYRPESSAPSAIGGSRIVQSLSAGSDTWISAALVGDVATAAFAGASRVSLVAALPLQVLNLLTAPWVSRLDPGALEARVRPIVRWLTTGTAALTLVVVSAGPDRVLRWIFGPDFPDAGGVLVAVLVAQLLNVASGPSGVALLQAGEERTLVVVQTWSLVVRVILLAGGAWVDKVEGMAVALVIASAAQSTWLAISARRVAGRAVHA